MMSDSWTRTRRGNLHGGTVRRRTTDELSGGHTHPLNPKQDDFVTGTGRFSFYVGGLGLARRTPGRCGPSRAPAIAGEPGADRRADLHHAARRHTEHVLRAAAAGGAHRQLQHDRSRPTPRGAAASPRGAYRRRTAVCAHVAGGAAQEWVCDRVGTSASMSASGVARAYEFFLPHARALDEADRAHPAGRRRFPSAGRAFCNEGAEYASL